MSGMGADDSHNAQSSRRIAELEATNAELSSATSAVIEQARRIAELEAENAVLSGNVDAALADYTIAARTIGKILMVLIEDGVVTPPDGETT